ncbi:MAG TPA: alpha-2-macroglobulin family protein [Cytophagaceae bacterium]|nr:alpha-2-macroglobulin family protein [Cytophagaceae bacterium]
MKKFEYQDAWKKVDDFQNKGLPESELKEVNTIYQQAKLENNTGQLVKAVIYQMKLTDYKEENAFVKNLNRVEAEIKLSQFPVKQLLHSMLAEMYWQYYQNNRWKYNNRTATVNLQEDDIETWSLEKIVQETIAHYEASLSEKEKLQAEDMHVYDEVIYKGNEEGRELRPTVYDFLANRAIDFYMNEEAAITRPAYFFSLDKEEYLSNAENFVKLTLSTKDTLSMKFHALVHLQDLTKFHQRDSKPDALVYVDLKRLDFVKQYLTVSNKNQLYENVLKELETKTVKYPVSTLVTLKIAQLYQEYGALYNPLQSDAHKWDLKKAYDYCEQAKLRFPESNGAMKCAVLQDNLLDKTMSAEVETTTIPLQPFKALLRYTNLQKIYWRLIPTTEEEVNTQRKKWDRNYEVDREEKFLQYFIAKKAERSGSNSLPDDGDMQQHSVELKLDGLPVSTYMVVYSYDPDFKTIKNGMVYAFTTVTNISYIHRNAPDGTTDVYTLDRNTGDPLAGVNVSVYFTEYNYKKSAYERITGGSFVSNGEGYVKIPHQVDKSNNYERNFSLKFSKGADQFNTDPVDGYSYGGAFYQSREEKPEIDTKVLFFMDRSIYRPGQTIYFKGLVIRTDGKTSSIVPKYSTVVALYDVNNQKVAELSLVSNEYGTFNGSFTAPTKGLMGQMHLQSGYGEGDVYFSVEEYKRPKFEVSFAPVKGSFRLNEMIEAEGTAQAYSGAGIDGAKVSYRVVRKARYPYWWWCKWGYYPTSPEIEITNGIAETDGSGKFKINFKAIPDPTVDAAADPTFVYTVYADVTDMNGETHSANTAISVGYKALQVSVSTDEMDKEDEKAWKKEYDINTTNLAGQFEPAKGTIKIYSLKQPEKAYRTRRWGRPDRQLMTREEYQKYFPEDEYEEENNFLKWAKDKEVLNAVFDTEKKKTLSLESLHSKPSGKYLLEITSVDKYGQEVKEVSYFTVFSTKDKKLAIPAIEYLQGLNTEDVEPGEKATFLVGTTASPVKVLYEIEKDEKIIFKEWMVLKNEQKLLEIPIKEEYRGNIAVHYTFVLRNRLYSEELTINMPYSNKELDIQFETFRDKLQPGEKEQWKIKIAAKRSDQVAAEMVATMYDASLDVFRPHAWYANFNSYMYATMGWSSTHGFDEMTFRQYTKEWNEHPGHYYREPYFDHLEWFGYSYYTAYYSDDVFKSADRNVSDVMITRSSKSKKLASPGAPAPMMKEKADLAEESEISLEADGKTAVMGGKKEEPKANADQGGDFSEVKVRSNFNETAFFYPTLQTNEKGELVINFTVPESLTRWKMLGFAHTKDLKSGLVTKELVTQKELMVVPNQPRFFRENDKMIFSVKITSLSNEELSGQARLEFFDALTMQPVDALMKNSDGPKAFTVKAGQSNNLEWNIQVPEGSVQAVLYRVVAKAGAFSDGEEMVLPVVTNSMLVTETLPLPIRGNQTKEFKLEKLLNNKSTTLRNHRFTLEFTSNPAWYAVQALPYLMEYPYECVEQTFSRYYANSIASTVANSNPRIKQVFDTWKNVQPDALLSNLEKNQELKSALLEETPWVLQAKDESQRKRSVALLFDLNRMADEMDRALTKVLKAQKSSGGFTWFPGFPEDRYMTQHIVAGMGHLDVLGVKTVRQDNASWNMVRNALGYIDREMNDDYQRLKANAKKGYLKLEDNHLDYLNIHYLYLRSYFKDVAVESQHKEAFDYFFGQAKKYWLDNGIYMQGMLCLSLNRFGETAVPQAMIKSFKERSLNSEEMGMYWKYERGYYWYQAPVETQALMIEVFDEVAKDQKSVDDLKVWLLKQKQTQDWKTTRATSEACYALLRRGSDFLASTQLVEIKVGNELVDPSKRPDVKVEAGTGYFKTVWTDNQINAGMGKITVSKKDDGVAWGAVYWQYFEQLDKITSAETPLKINKKLFLQQNTDRGPVITPIVEGTPLKVGDLIKVRIEIRVDRNMEYVHLKDMRAAAFEPVTTLSTYRYQDGLYYYESPRDLAMNFFIGFLPKGTYVFEYPLRVSQKGDFSNGITTMQCMYAPEFSSHSEGIRVKVK